MQLHPGPASFLSVREASSGSRRGDGRIPSIAIAEAGVAKASFYHHFPSKQALVHATLERRDVEVRNWLCGAAEARAQSGAMSPVLALFDVVARWAASDGFPGCAFLHAVFDTPQNDATRRLAAAHKQRLEAWIAARLGGGPDIAPPAAALMVLLDGGVAQAFIHRDPGRIATARAVAASLLEHRQ